MGEGLRRDARVSAPDSPHGYGATWRFWLVIALLCNAILSQFYRSSNTVIAPELIRDLGLSPQMLGFANGSFFIALLIAQVPLGVVFDKVGVRKAASALFLPMVAGAALHGIADSGWMLVAARFLVGLGCAGSFMAVIILIPRWFPQDRWSTMLGLVFGISQLGILASGPPLALATETIGWRQAFVWCAGLSVLVGLVFAAIVRDRPVRLTEAAHRKIEHVGALEGLRQIVRLPDMLKLFAMFGVSYPTLNAVTGLWAGPYLKDVHGLDAVARGQVIAAIAIALVIGNFIIGPIDRAVGRPKLVVATGAAIAIAVFGIFALAPTLPLWVVVALLFTLSVAASYAPVLLTQMRSRFPDHLAGRGSTTANITQLLGAAVLPIITGAIPPLFEISASGGYSPLAYRWMFALLAVILGAGLAVYLTLRETVAVQTKPTA